MAGLSGMDSIAIPEGWSAIAMFGRLVTGGICSYEYLKSPNTTAKDVFGMLRMLDIKDFIELKSAEKYKAKK